MSADREWWLRVPRVLTRPSEVFAALRSDDDEDLSARQEPVLAIAILAGTAAVLLTPTWRRLMDESSIDGLVVAVLTFVGGLLYGLVGYMLLGGLLYLLVRGLGGTQGFRLARHVVAFSAVPLALSLFLVAPAGLLAFGADWFRSGGSDEGAAGAIVLVLGLAFVAWSLALLLVGVRVVYGFSWARCAGALALVALVLAAVFLPSAL